MTRRSNGPRVIAPNLKRRLSGVTATILRLIPIQSRKIDIVATGPNLPENLPQIPLWQLITLPRRPVVWHARRNNEMLLGLALKHLLRKDIRLLFTSASQREHTQYTRWLISKMDAVIATSDRSAAYLRRPAIVIRHGIDCDTFCPSTDKSSLRKTLGLPSDAVIAGCFGRIRPQKGTDVFVEAMLALCPLHPRLVGLVLGRATSAHTGFLSDLRTRVESAGLSERILFLPEVPATETPAFYQAIDLYVALQRNEGFGLTPLEAMSCGVPSVATRVGAFDEILDDGRTGTLIAPGDPAALTAAIDEVLGHPPLLAAWAANCRPRALAGFRIEDEANALIEVYESLLSRR